VKQGRGNGRVRGGGRNDCVWCCVGSVGEELLCSIVSVLIIGYVMWEMRRRMTQGEILEVGGDGTPGDVPPGDVTPGGEDPSTKWKKYVIKLLKYIVVGIGVYIGYKISQGGDGGGGVNKVVNDIVEEIVNDIGGGEAEVNDIGGILLKR
jgi:hypothetical protein